MTPIRTATDEYQRNYNIAHRASRNCVERCIGVLKGRFRILGKDRILRYAPQKTGIIINSCAVLHNMMIEANVPLQEISVDDDEYEEVTVDEDGNMEGLHNYLEMGIAARNNLISEYFH